MGHGASTPLPPPDRYHKRFLEVERKCASGHFHTFLAEYREAVQSAIRCDALDFLEVLLVGGPAKVVYPLHMACMEGKLEAVDLMLTAGFPAFAKDAHGNTPLHCTVQCADDEEAAALCAAAICIQIPQLHKVYNRDGYTVLHLAAQTDHLTVFTTVLQFGGDLKQKTLQGETLKDICEKMKSQRILQILEGDVDTKHPSSNIRKISINNASAYTPQPPRNSGDLDRVLAVWDRFFENAFALHEARLAGTHSTLQQNLSAASAAAASSSSKATRQVSSGGLVLVEDKHKQVASKRGMQEYKEWKHSQDTHAADDGYDYSYGHGYKTYGYDGYEDTKHTSSTGYIHQEVDAVLGYGYADDAGTYTEVLDWLSYVMHASHGDGDGLMVVTDTRDSCVYSVHEFVEYIEQFYAHLPYAASEFLPTNLLVCVQQRYVTYYDAEQNMCMWCGLYTHHTPSTLPLGYDAYLPHGYSNLPLLSSLGLLSYDDMDFYAIQLAAQSWVMVLVEEDEEDRRRKPKNMQHTHSHTDAQDIQMHYYYNTTTHQTTWLEPKGYGGEVEGGGDGWRVCCMESNPYAYFHYNMYTGESVWA
ncbi:ankyrin repeat domain-containing protein [archaeon]|nr:MAG: ankyrin repeat domain-containing protein [archaeon]